MNIKYYSIQGVIPFLVNMIIGVSVMCVLCIILDIILQRVMFPFKVILNKLPFANYCLSFIHQKSGNPEI